MIIGDEITIPTGYKVKHARVYQVTPHGWFRVSWVNKRNGRSTRTLIERDEGLRWARGHLDPSSVDAHALTAAQALAGESPWIDGLTLKGMAA